MTPSELKYQYQIHNQDGHFFDRETMVFFGDTMRNFRVRATCIQTMGGSLDVWELYRKRPVKNGLTKSAYFRRDTFEQTFEKVE